MADPEFLLDANICIYLLNGNSEPVRRRVEACDVGTLATSAIAFSEVMIGAQRDDSVGKALAFFEAVQVLSFDRGAALAYSRLTFKRANFDRLIAAHALSTGLVLVTGNEAHFADVPGLKIENWTA